MTSELIIINVEVGNMTLENIEKFKLEYHDEPLI